MIGTLARHGHNVLLASCRCGECKDRLGEYPEILARVRARYYSTALDVPGLQANAPIAPSGDANGIVDLVVETNHICSHQENDG